MLRVMQLVGFGGGGQGAVSITNQNLLDQQTTPTDTYAGYRLNTNGKAQTSTGIAESYSDVTGEWLRSGSASAFECRATLNSGTLFSGTTGSWLALTSTRQWDVKYTSNLAGSSTADLTVEIRRVGGTVVSDSATILLEAEVTV